MSLLGKVDMVIEYSLFKKLHLRQLRIDIVFHESNHLVHGLPPVRSIAGHDSYADSQRLQSVLRINLRNRHIKLVTCFLNKTSTYSPLVF